MKGVELPINVMIVIVLAIIVLIAVVVLFFGVWNPGKSSISLETAKTNACQMLVSLGCGDYTQTITISNFGDGQETLQSLCEDWYHITPTYGTDHGLSCRKLCGCNK